MSSRSMRELGHWHLGCGTWANDRDGRGTIAKQNRFMDEKG